MMREGKRKKSRPNGYFFFGFHHCITQPDIAQYNKPNDDEDNTFNDVLGLVRDLLPGISFEGELSVFDLAHDGAVTGGVFGAGSRRRLFDIFDRLEWRPSAEHRVKNDAQGPKIARFVVRGHGPGHGNT